MDDARLMRLPKTELHLHIEGTLEPEMTFDLARRHGLQLPYADVDDLRAQHDFTDLPHFLDLYYSCMSVLRGEEDFADLAVAYLRVAAAQGVRHAEVFFDPQAHTSRDVPLAQVVSGLRSGLDRAGAELNVSADLIACFLRDRPVREAHETFDALTDSLDAITGIGLDSAEVGYPPELFVEVFDRAREAGLHLVAHAGEEGPPEYVWQAVDLLGVERVDHGIRSVESPSLVRRLAADRIPLTVCPLSNVRLQAVSHLSAHPLPQMLNEGLVVSLHSDDPAYFGGHIGDTYVRTARELDLSDETVVALARNSVQSSFLSDAAKQHLDDEITAEVTSAV